MERKSLGRYLRPSFDIGEAMCALILTKDGGQVSRTSVFPPSVEDSNSEEVTQKKQDYETALKSALRDRYNPLDGADRADETPEPDFYVSISDRDEPQAPIREADDIQHEAFDKYVSSRVCIHQGDGMSYGTVVRRKRDSNGELTKHSNRNPLMDTSIYEVEFDNGDTESYSANIITEAIYSQIDAYYSLDEIIDHKSDGTAVKEDDAYITRNGRRVLRQTTKGWKLCCRGQMDPRHGKVLRI